MKSIKLIFALQLMFFITSLSAGNLMPESLDGCQGEGCSCLQGYRETTKRDFEIPTIRPFTLYANMSKKSQRLGDFKARTNGLPGKQIILVDDPGEYLVDKIQRGLEGLKVGDHVNTLIYLGEGASKVRKDKKWISFDDEQITLKELRPIKLTEWMEVSVGTLHGYTTDSPFEGCLE